MKKWFLVFCGLAAALATGRCTGLPAWPEQTMESKPWAYWWWMGSAVDKTNLTRELQRYHDAGLGGVHIIPIYGAKGWESNYIEYISQQWMAMLRHTVTEARRLEMGVDMTTGSGWCFGGPAVSNGDANALLEVDQIEVSGETGLTNEFNRASIQALAAFSSNGAHVDLTSRIDTNGHLNWTAPAGEWTVYQVGQRFSGQMVKRAAPGGQGPMLNLIYPSAMDRFLERFTKAFAAYDGPMPRAMYHDSYEYKSDWAPDFLNQFAWRRGYRLEEELPAFLGQGDVDQVARVKCDYRETVSELITDESLSKWVAWSHRRGMIARNEAHGSPGNWLDMYAVADVAETEMFNHDRNILISKFASSASHDAGHRFTGSETGTWLKEHFTETLGDLKGLFDDMFLSGVNHMFYHGTCYSPDEAGWPGWVFYASTEMNPRNPIWRDVPALNAYAARCQSVLQSGHPGNDVLLYWPIYDKWQQPEGRLQTFIIHNARDWFENQPISAVAGHLWQSGYGFDYVSDKLLASAHVEKGGVSLGDGQFKVVFVPECHWMPVETLRHLLDLSSNGATVVFEKHLPEGVPGWGNLEKRQAQFRRLISSVQSRLEASATVTTLSGDKAEVVGATIGKGHVYVGEWSAALSMTGLQRETLTDHPGLSFVRRDEKKGSWYFIANRGDAALDGWITLATPARSVTVLDPMTGRIGAAAQRSGPNGLPEIYLQLSAGQSIILRTLPKPVLGTEWPYEKTVGKPVEIAGMWDIQFIHGGPTLPGKLQTNRLASWTSLGGPETQAFAGTARYTIRFDAPAGAGDYSLDLGRVCQSARVRLNGQDLGTMLTAPFRVPAAGLKPAGNKLEIEVTSVAANRIRDLDQRGVAWKTFHDINLVGMDYKPFDASGWPLADAGLIGPVTLTSVTALKP